MAHTRTIVLVLAAVGIVAFATGYLHMPIPAGGDLPQAYANSAMKFSLRLPDGYTADESYKYTELGPDEEIAGIKFTIPSSVATGTNLSSDSYISVEQIPDLPSCIAGPFLWKGQRIALSPSDDATPFLVASSTGAAAGNRYEETVYALQDTNPCTAIRYMLHYGAMANYPEGAVREYDRAALLATFDAIRRSLKVGE
ncbi:MAG: hypothetical protein WCT45_02430 [Candidatus Paceibacterota bacterium]|jgi:hypothetical protein